MGPGIAAPWRSRSRSALRALRSGAGFARSTPPGAVDRLAGPCRRSRCGAAAERLAEIARHAMLSQQVGAPARWPCGRGRAVGADERSRHRMRRACASLIVLGRMQDVSGSCRADCDCRGRSGHERQRHQFGVRTTDNHSKENGAHDQRRQRSENAEQAPRRDIHDKMRNMGVANLLSHGNTHRFRSDKCGQSHSFHYNWRRAPINDGRSTGRDRVRRKSPQGFVNARQSELVQPPYRVRQVTGAAFSGNRASFAAEAM